MEATQGDASPRRLTPADVHNIAFTRPPIGKRGYHEQEVDDFLDVVEQELSRLIEDNEQLKAGSGADPSAVSAATEKAVAEERSRLQSELESVHQRYQELDNRHNELQRDHYQLQQAQGDSGEVSQQLQEQLRQANERVQRAEEDSRQAHEALAQAQANPGPPASSAEQHQQAVKVLALAQATADQHVAEAQA